MPDEHKQHHCADHVDNQGRCHTCGAIVDALAWAAYQGDPKPTAANPRKPILRIKNAATARATELGHKLMGGWHMIDRDTAYESRGNNCTRCLAGVVITDREIHPPGRIEPMKPGAYGRAVEDPCRPLSRPKRET